MKTITRLDLTDARALIAGAAAHADSIGVPMCIAITDESGQLIAFERMEGGKVTSTTIAIDKAFTAAAAKKATHDYGSASQPGAPAYGINSSIGGRLMVVGGGLPSCMTGRSWAASACRRARPRRTRRSRRRASTHGPPAPERQSRKVFTTICCCLVPSGSRPVLIRVNSSAQSELRTRIGGSGSAITRMTTAATSSGVW